MKKTFTAERYFNFLTIEIIPTLAFIFPNEVNPDVSNEIMWFQRDVAPRYFGVIGEYLDLTMRDPYNERRGTIE